MKDNFGKVFDSLNRTFGDVEGILGQLYEDIKKDSNNYEKMDLFSKMTDVANNLLTSQMCLVDSCTDKDMKEYCRNSILQNQQLIRSTIEEINGRSFK